MNIFCNGESRIVATNFTLKELLAQLGYDRAGVAAAVNDSVIPTARWESCILKESDQILVIQAAQGG